MSDNLIDDAKTQITGMAKQGIKHPATSPVLTGAAIGAVAGWALPLVSILGGAVIGAGVMFYKKLRP